jgi:hypothetical protein
MRRRPFLRAALLYAALTAILTFPVLGGIGSVIPHDDADPILNTWILSWNAGHVPLTAGWWNAPIFHPATGMLALSEHLLGLVPLAAPVAWLGGNPLLAYNAVFVLSFFLSALAAHALAHELTGRHDAALAAGLAYGFAPYRIVHLAHLQVLCGFYMPLALWALHRYRRVPRARWLVVFALAWLLQGLANGYYLFYFSLFVGLWLGWFALPEGRWRTMLPRVLLAGVVAGSALAPFLLAYHQVHLRFALERPLYEIKSFSADLLSLLDASPNLAVWGSLRVHHQPEGELFPGFAVVILVAAGVIHAILRIPRPERRPAVQTILVVAAAAFAVTAVLVAVFGPWRMTLGPFRFRSGAADRLRDRAVLALVGAGLLSRPFRDAWRRGSPLPFYAAMAPVCWELALGPWIHRGGEMLGARGPYALLMLLPGFDALRVPARFAMLATLALAVAAGLAAARILPVEGRIRRLAVALVAVGLLSDGWPKRLPVVPAPGGCPALAAEPGRGAVLEVPFGATRLDTHAMWRSMRHHRPLVNGYSGFHPPHYDLVRTALSLGDRDLLLDLSRRGVELVYVTQHHGPWSDFLGACPGVSKAFDCPLGPVYRLAASEPAGKEAPPPRRGPPLKPLAIRANVNAYLVPFLKDRDLATRWNSNRQRGREEIRIDLGEEAALGDVVLALGGDVSDYPRYLVVEVSTDDAVWSEAWSGPGSVPALAGAIAEPARVPLLVELGGRRGRYLRLTQRGRDRRHFWSIAELEVHAVAAEH